MKLLLTATGLSNEKIVNAFNKLIGKSPEDIRIAFIPTAANIEDGDKGWLIKDLHGLKQQGYYVDLVDISAVRSRIWKPRIESVDALMLGGGNTFHLMHWVQKSGLQELLPELLKSKVYVGISAGSCITGPTIYNSVQNLFGEQYDLKIKNGLGLVDFQFIPHLNSSHFAKIRKEFLENEAKGVSDPVYAADDNTALKVTDGKVEVVTKGECLSFNL